MSKKEDLLKVSIVQGFSTLIVREFFLKLFSFLGQIFLARILAPSDFGIYVIIVFIINFFSLFSDVGLSLAIIQKKEEPTASELSVAFFLKLFLSLTLILIIIFLSSYIKFFYPSFTNENVSMLRLFSIILLLTSLRAIPISLLERKIKYNLISILDILGVFIYYVVSIFGAALGLGAWSLILGTILKELSETIIIYFIQPFFPKISFNLNQIKEMVKFGIYIQGKDVVGFLGVSITPVIGGRLMGPYAVGLLDFANNIASLPTTVSINFGRVAFAGYSRIQEQEKQLYNSMAHSVSMLAIMLYIFPVIIFCFSNELIPLIFSSKWQASIPALYWYSAATFFLPIMAPMGQGILAIGKSKEIFIITLITTIISWIGAYFLIQFLGFVGISIIYFLMVLLLCIFYVMILRNNGYKLPLINILFPKLIVVTISFIFSLFLNNLLPSTLNFLIFKLILCLISYFLLMFLFAKNDTLEFISLIINSIKFKKI